MISSIVDELNKENGSNYKINVLKKHKDNDLLQRVLKMTYDKAAYTYGVSVKQIEKFEPQKVALQIDLDFALTSIASNLATREVTGHAAYQLASNLIGNLPKEDGEIVKKLFNRDLRINLGKSSINKVFKGLITKPVYKRCDTYNKKTAKNISYPSMVQLKADGTYREFNVDDSIVTCQSRSGEKYEYPSIFETMSNYRDGFYMGELTVRCSDEIIKTIQEKLEKAKKKGDDTEKLEEVISQYQKHKDKNKEYILPRSIGNGLIKSDEVPYKNIILDLWEYVSPEEYIIASKKDRKNPCTVPYSESFDVLKEIVGNGSENIRIIEYKIVDSLPEALSITSEWMKDGFEGSIIKDLGAVFKDGTSKQQLKLKLKISLEVRITGFTEGEGKNKDYFGAITFENDEGTIKGKVGVNSMTEVLRDWFHENRESLIGKIMEVECNDITRAEGHDFYALSHPRFVELRDDKDESDTLEKAFKLREMAMELS